MRNPLTETSKLGSPGGVMDWNAIVPCLLVALPAARASPPAAEHAARRPVHTYSIVARDPRTGELGAAVQSHYFSVGPIVPWVESGVGAVATQAFAEGSYGPE